MRKFSEIYPEWKKLMLEVLFSEGKLKKDNLINLKKYYAKIKNKIPEKASKSCDKTIKNLEKIVKKPTTPHYGFGGKQSYSKVHRNGKPYSKEELEELNYFESIHGVNLGYLEHRMCMVCHKPLIDAEGKRITNRAKTCSDICSANYRRLQKKREEVGAIMILNKVTSKKPQGVRPSWKDMEAIYEVKLKRKTKYITKKLPAKKGKSYDQGVNSVNQGQTL